MGLVSLLKEPSELVEYHLFWVLSQVRCKVSHDIHLLWLKITLSQVWTLVKNQAELVRIQEKTPQAPQNEDLVHTTHSPECLCFLPQPQAAPPSCRASWPGETQSWAHVRMRQRRFKIESLNWGYVARPEFKSVSKTFVLITVGFMQRQNAYYHSAAMNTNLFVWQYYILSLQQNCLQWSKSVVAEYQGV